MLRGMYFISGTQEGTPIDRLLGSIARSYKLERAILAPNQASGKSYFLTRLLGEVVFAESGIAGTNLRWERRRTLATLAAYAALALLTIGGDRRMEPELPQQPPVRRRGRGARRSGSQDRAGHAEPPDGRPAAGDGGTRHREGAREARPERQSAVVAGLRPVPGRQTRQCGAQCLRTHAGRCGAAAPGAACRGAVARRRQRHGNAVRGAQGLPDAERARSASTARAEALLRKRLGCPDRARARAPQNVRA